MADKVKPIPDGYHSITPYIVVKGAAAALDFYKKVFSATELMRMDGPEGKIMHAEFKIGNSVVMIADEFPEMGFISPAELKGSPIGLMVYVEDVDRIAKAAVDAGATELKPVENQFYGDRSGTYRDPFGHVWTIATHVEDVPEEEMERRAAAQGGGE